ncbi:MAG: hypothetical protein ACRDEA_10595 [Microcystaceae cyanobacterium]
MTAENLETNGNQGQEPTKSTRATKKPANEVVALSVKDKLEATSHGLKLLEQPGGLPGNRPIEASHLHVVSTYTSVGGSRPVTASGMEVSGTLAISGNRPIAVSHLNVSETYSVMGNRPVASNEIDDPTVLMGYLD